MNSIESLPLEILNEILIFLNQFSSIYNCLFVSRKWCKLTIPLLWRKPLSINARNIFKIISTFKLLLDDNSNQMFNYCEFINKIDYQNLYSLISIKKKNEILHLSYLIFDLFIKKCINLTNLTFNTFNFDYKFFHFEFTSCYLSRLRFVEFDQISSKISFINCLCQCKLIEIIVIKLSEDDSKISLDPLIKLIINQINLKSFNCAYSSSLVEFNASEIIEALIFKKYDKLSHIEFTECQFDNQNSLYKFSCLKNFKLVLNNCKIHCESNNDKYEYIEDNFINCYFNFAPKFCEFNFDLNKESNTIIIKISSIL